MSEFDYEPKTGLPDKLPDGETLLWQGAPDWLSLARRALHGHLALIYIGLVALWGSFSAYTDGLELAGALAASLRIMLAGAAGLALLSLVARLIAKTTTYSITNQRIVLRIGVALPLTITIPLRLVQAADLKVYADGTGDIPIATTGPVRLGFVPLWPHVRAWRLKKPEPVLRCIPDAAKVAERLAITLAAAHGVAPKSIAEERRGAEPGAVYGESGQFTAMA